MKYALDNFPNEYSEEKENAPSSRTYDWKARIYISIKRTVYR